MQNSLYSEVILSHSHSRKNRGELVNSTAVERGHNPNCGDDLTLMVTLNENIIKDAKFIGSGCAISTASMSIMIDLVKGKCVEEAKILIENFLNMIKGDTLSKEQKCTLKDAVIFESLKDMPARVKCGTLGWHCLQVIVSNK